MRSLIKFVALLLVVLLVATACRREAPAPEPAAEPAAEVEATEAPAEEAAEAEATEAPAEEAPAEEAAEAEATEAPAEEAAPATEGATVKIAFMGPLTGGAAFIGTEMLGFAQAVAAIYSEQTGLDIQIVEGDTEINPDVGRIVAESMAADAEIIGVVGPAGSQVCEAVMSIFEEAELAYMTPSCTKTDLTQPGSPVFFRPIPTDADQSKTIADYMVNTLAITSIYQVDDQSSYSVGLNDELEALLTEAGITAIERASVTQEETDFSSVVTAILAAGSDVVFFPGQIEGQLGTMAVQLREQGYEGIYFLADGGFSLGWVETAGDAANGTYLTFFAPDPNLVPEAEEMNARYAADHTEQFGAFGGAAGLTTQIMLEAVASCAAANDLSRTCVRDTLAATNLENTVLGIPVSFGEGNQAQGSSFFLFQVEDGAFKLLN